MTQVLVTGGAGFLGSHLCDRLIARGDEVLCVDNFYTGGKVLLQSSVDRHHILPRTISRRVSCHVGQRCQYRLHCGRRQQVHRSIRPRGLSEAT